MPENLLTIRTYGNVLKHKMSKSAVIKFYDADKRVFVASPDVIERDASKQETLYNLLFESLLYTLRLDEGFRFPDISKSWISETINAKIPVNSEILKAAQKKEAAAAVATYFDHNIIPNIPKHMLSMVVDGVSSLVQDDTKLGKKKRDSLKSARDRKSEADFLADVWILAVCNGTEYNTKKTSNNNITRQNEVSAESPFPANPDYDDTPKKTHNADVESQDEQLNDHNGCQHKTDKKATSGKNRLFISLWVILLAVCKSKVNLISIGSSVVVVSVTVTLVIGSTVQHNYTEISTPLFNVPYVDIGDSAGYEAYGDDENNTIKIYSREETILYEDIASYTNFVTFDLDGNTSRFTATLHPPNFPLFNPKLTYKIIGDGKLLFEKVLGGESPPTLVDVDTSGVDQLTIEVDLINKVYHSFTSPYYKGIQNATIMIVE